MIWKEPGALRALPAHASRPLQWSPNRFNRYWKGQTEVESRKNQELKIVDDQDERQEIQDLRDDINELRLLAAWICGVILAMGAIVGAAISLWQ